ncbi:hypothetical protein OXPF_07060 [Oxobacter pfennigii]|uniref:SLH domain-containing protein n=1 Tax=Oxobacter pfennigii TaxID=36849 RepID=A0A0P9AJ61_9CLOT|nr:S-layer homology domain-containing protein [Oxobacter pfennigii]KPU45473.1 hypothetical protein OXPF_07060 [Oxobacter pfennigii]
MKKKTSILLVLTLLISLVIPVTSFAEDNTGLNNAISTAKNLIGIIETYDDFSYNMYTTDGKTVYGLNWRDSKNLKGSVDVTIDSNNRILNYYSYKPYEKNKDSKMPTVSKTEAKAKADEFIKKINPEMWTKLEFKEDAAPVNINDTGYYFSYIRIENGIPFMQNNVNVTVNNSTGKVESFYSNWTDDLVFPQSSNLIKLDEAEKIYAEKLGLKLGIKMNYTDKNRTPYLVYTNVYNNRSIDAITGEIVSASDIYYALAKEASARGASYDMAAGNTASIPLTPEELSAVQDASNFIAQTKAEDIARKLLALNNTFKLESVNLYSTGQNDEFSWSLYFTKETKSNDKATYESASISIDAKTGEVLNFYRYSSNDNEGKVKYDKDQSLKKAQDFIKSMQPSRVSEIEYTTWQEGTPIPYAQEEAPRNYYFTFTRKADGAYFIDNGFNVTVNAVSGEITNYSYNWYKGELPDASAIINSEQAHKILFENVGLTLQYVADYSNPAQSKVIAPPAKDTKPTIRLVYAVNTDKPSNIHAVTGKLLDYAGTEYKEKTVSQYTDIAGHSAEDRIRILAEYGISLDGTEFKPNENIIQKDFLYLLQKSIDPYVSFKPTGEKQADEDFYNYLIRSGIILENEKDPLATVKKEDAVKFLIRGLKYDSVAKIQGIFNLPFTDKDSINPELQGHMAIAYGLGIIKDDNGSINPSSLITRADAAVALYNFLNAN